MNSIGYSFYWSALISATVFASSMQYVAITLFTTSFNPLNALVLTLMINARHLFYGISMLNKLKGTGKFKPFLIFSMCDETFSVLCNINPPKDVNKGEFFFCIAFLDYIYWITGSLLGGILGDFISFNTKGLDFVLTALFVVTLLQQLENKKSHIPSLLGMICCIFCLIVFGKKNFIIPSMILILLALTLLKSKIERSDTNDLNNNTNLNNN